MVTKALAGHRNELARQSKDARLALTRELSALADRIKSAEAHYRSPMQMLMRDTLGDERRSRIQSQIEQSGASPSSPPPPATRSWPPRCAVGSGA